MVIDMLSVDVEKQLGDFKLETSFTSDGLVTGLFGNSGAGKTSIINLIAGLIAPDRGRISIDNETLDDTSTAIHVAPHRRRIGYVFQDARLFPHLSVRQNLDYGRRMNGFAPDAAAETADAPDVLGQEPLHRELRREAALRIEDGRDQRLRDREEDEDDEQRGDDDHDGRDGRIAAEDPAPRNRTRETHGER